MHTRTYLYIHTYTYTPTFTSIYTRAYIYIHTYIYTHWHSLILIQHILLYTPPPESSSSTSILLHNMYTYSPVYLYLYRSILLLLSPPPQQVSSSSICINILLYTYTYTAVYSSSSILLLNMYTCSPVYVYKVATISRLPKNIGLFCKRALHKRLYSAQGTYHFKEPTNRSHPILILLYTTPLVSSSSICIHILLYVYTCTPVNAHLYFCTCIPILLYTTLLVSSSSTCILLYMYIYTSLLHLYSFTTPRISSSSACIRLLLYTPQLYSYAHKSTLARAHTYNLQQPLECTVVFTPSYKNIHTHTHTHTCTNLHTHQNVQEVFLRSAVVGACTNLHWHTCYSSFEIHSRIYTVIYKTYTHTSKWTECVLTKQSRRGSAQAPGLCSLVTPCQVAAFLLLHSMPVWNGFVGA